MAIVDTILFTKIGEQAVRVGDVGKTVIRDLPENPTIDSRESENGGGSPFSRPVLG